MGSLYDTTSNIYFSEYREISLTNSGYFKLPDENAKLVTVWNDSNNVIQVAKTTDQTYKALAEDFTYFAGEAARLAGDKLIVSGDAYVTGRSLVIEDDIIYQVKGVSNANQVSIRKHAHSTTNHSVKYIIEK